MSFMFHPYPYSDPEAVNAVTGMGVSPVRGLHNVARTIAGLRSFPEKVILIAGGYDKHIPYDVLGPEICKHVKKLFLGGATGEKIRQAVISCPEYDSQKLEIMDCGSFEPAVRAAAAAAKAGDVVLMSPASAAFDQFKNFMVRGEYYKKLVKEL